MSARVESWTPASIALRTDTNYPRHSIIDSARERTLKKIACIWEPMHLLVLVRPRFATPKCGPHVAHKQEHPPEPSKTSQLQIKRGKENKK